MGLDLLYTKLQQAILKRCCGDEDWFMLINHGAKRSGKTEINNDLFIMELIRVRKQADLDGVAVPQYILAGATLGTIQKNVLTELYNKYGFEFKLDRFNSFSLMGVKVVQVGHSTIGGLSSIRGMTAYGAYMNEGSLANEEVFNEIISRCSGNGARILVDTNPDHPEHWLKKHYIDKASDKVVCYHFRLTDNSFLNQRYVDNIIATTPSGMFTDRNIFGLWVIGEGAVYRDFDERKHFIDSAALPTPRIKRYFAGVDWGYEHFGVLLVFGVDDTGVFYLVEEYAAQHREIDFWVMTAKNVVLKYGDIPFFCDGARPEHVARFKREGIRALLANKSVLSGIECVASLLKRGALFVCRDRVARFMQEIYQYAWDAKTGEPIKALDDVMDAMRYALYSDAVLNIARKTPQSGKAKREILRRFNG